MRVLVEVNTPAGTIGLIVPWRDLTVEDWRIYLMPLAEMVAVAHPWAEWAATPIPEETSDKDALLGH